MPELEERFDRVIMPLPGSAIAFFDVAVKTLKESGTIHLYSFVEEENFRPVEQKIEGFMNNQGLAFEIVDRVRCGYKSPSEDRYCFDTNVFE